MTAGWHRFAASGQAPPALQRFTSILKAACLPLLTGAVWTLAFPGAEIAGLAWLVPALVLLTAQAGTRPFVAGYWAGLAGWLGMLHWLLFIPFPAGAFGGWFCLSAYVALYPALWAWLCWRTLPAESGGTALQRLGRLSWSRRQAWALGCAALWTGLELVQNRLMSGFPWNSLGVSQFRLTPLIQLATVTGVAGVTFLIVWFSTCLLGTMAVLLREPGKRRTLSGEILLPLLAVVTIYVAGMETIRAPAAERRTLKLALVQPSIPQLLIWDPTESTNRFHALLELTRAALTNHPDAVVWPEASLPSITREDYDELVGVLRQGGVPLIFGADDADSVDGVERYFNASFIVNTNGRPIASYRKRQLVIFGEYIPLESWLPFMKWLTPIGSGFASGDGPGAFPIQAGGEILTASPLICFEDMFAPLARGSVAEETDFLLNLTNDGWFGKSSEQWQQAASALFRAVENRRPLVRCTNNGLTCWIDEFGRLRQILRDARGSIYAPGILLAEVEIPRPVAARTFYQTNGDWLGWSCAGVAAAWSLFSLGWPFRRLGGSRPK
jgi:apolipoprotein N-acyltransferase